jgi:hypothetical protein
LEITEDLWFALQKGSSDGLGGVTALELHGEGMFGQCDVRLLLIGLQCRLEKRVKMSGSRPVGHITSGEEMGTLEGGLVGCEEMVARRWEGWGEEGQCTASVPHRYVISTHRRKVIT